MTVEFLDELPRPESGSPAEAHAVLVEFADSLRANPGRWAVYPGQAAYPGSTGTRIRMGHAAAFRPAGSFETAVRAKTLYVRFVGVPVPPSRWIGPEAIAPAAAPEPEAPVADVVEPVADVVEPVADVVEPVADPPPYEPDPTTGFWNPAPLGPHVTYNEVSSTR